MKPFNDYYEHRICGHYLSALINGDYSGLDKIEEREFDAWLEKNHIVGSVYDVVGDEGNFELCEVSDLMGDVYLVKQHFHNPEVTA
jgi:hypothetical protein